MSKKLTSTKYPFLPLTIHVRVSSRKHIDLQTQALIDTGFSGDIVVPAGVSAKRLHGFGRVIMRWTRLFPARLSSATMVAAAWATMHREFLQQSHRHTLRNQLAMPW